uniref:PD-(D/E)XK nuclease superfamily protein n=2 Tax=viral metagenome TaxID=1070528 RepID=A0A6M3JNF6_9ZZZZ
MATTKDAPKKSRAHTIYKTEDGVRIPGVTTVLNVLNKPALVKWANNLGLQGIDSSKYRDSMADIGTLAHQMILDYFKGEKTDTSEYSSGQIDLAENCLLSFWEWEKGHDIKVIMAEVPLISREYGYGGTIDCFCELDGQATLLDFKTGKAIYEEMVFQVSSYRHLLIENGHSVDSVKILRIGRDATEGFDEKTIYNCETGWQIFLRCLDIYNLKKDLKA